MADAVQSAHDTTVVVRRSKLKKFLSNKTLWRGLAAIIGFIIPGLIAIWYQRQGVLETTLSLVTAAILVRMVLVVFVGDVTI